MIKPQVRVNKSTYQMLLLKKKATGRSFPELLEYAVMDMRFIPPKKIKK